MRRAIGWCVGIGVLLACAQVSAQTASNVVCTGCVNGTDIAVNSVNSAKIVDGSVKTADLAANVVTTDKIRDGNVTMNDLNPQLRQMLRSAISNLTMVDAYASDVGVVGVECPADKIAVSASCACIDDTGNRNYGVLQGCFVEGNGAVASCYPDALTYEETFDDPLAEVVAVCVGAELADGSAWVPDTVSLVTNQQPSSKNGGEAARATLDRKTAFHRALIEAQNQQAAYKNRLLRRK